MFALTTPEPSPSPSTTPIELWEASPGLTGFIFGFFVLGIALIFLMWSMSRHLRRAQHNDPERAGADSAATAPHKPRDKK